MVWCGEGEGIIRTTHPALEGTWCGDNRVSEIINEIVVSRTRFALFSGALRVSVVHGVIVLHRS